MRRRHFLAASAVAVFAGCSQPTPQRGSPPTPPALPQVTLSAAETSPEKPNASLAVAYNSRVQLRVPTTPPTSADAGRKWLVLRMDVTNRGERSRDLDANQYVITTDTSEYEFTPTLADWELTTKRATPGETVTGWVAFHVPASLTEATLSVKAKYADDYAISFTQDRTLNAKIPN